MGKFVICKEVSMTMNIEVEAVDEDEALEKIADAWADNDYFVHNYLYQADIAGSEDYVVHGTADARFEDMKASVDPTDNVIM